MLRHMQKSDLVCRVRLCVQHSGNSANRTGSDNLIAEGEADGGDPMVES